VKSVFGRMRVAKMVYYKSGQLQKVSPKGNYKDKCFGGHQLTTFIGKPNAF